MTGDSGESEQEFERVSVRLDGVRTGIVLRGEVAQEEGGHEGGEIWRRHDGPPSLIRYPKRRSCRRTISPTISAVSCKYRCELARPTCPRYVAQAGNCAPRSASCWYHTSSLSTANP